MCAYQFYEIVAWPLKMKLASPGTNFIKLVSTQICLAQTTFCKANTGYQPETNALCIEFVWFLRAEFCLATFSSQHFLLNRFMKFGPGLTQVKCQNILERFYAFGFYTG